MARNAAPMGNGEFLEKAESIEITLGDKTITLDPRQFGTGSVGFGFSGKVTIVVGGVKVPCQASINVTMIGSKDQAQAAA